ncbi:MAG TPA: dockerin type I domain-containing protein, partial [Pirellulales bacterium]
VANSIAHTQQLVLDGGTFATGGFSQAMNTTPLQVSFPSTIDMGGTANTLHLADSSGQNWGSSGPGQLLTINGWTAGGGEHILFDGPGLTGNPSSGQLNQIHFTGYEGTAVLGAVGELLPSTNIQLMRGDVTGDGTISASDIDRMQLVITNLHAFESNTMPGGNGYGTVLNDGDALDIVDVNHDGSIDNADLQSLIFLATNPGPAPPLGVPEPSSWLLAVLCLALGSRLRKRHLKTAAVN